MQSVEWKGVAVNRDMDLIRDILLHVEADPTLDGTGRMPFDNAADFPSHSLKEIMYHADLLIESGMLKGNVGGEMPMVSRLTWNGHEFLDSIRNPEIWERVKERLTGLGTVGLTLVWELAKAELRKKLKLT
jgi:hypothetical protein